MKAVLYTRVSTDEQRKESIDDQLRECRELCRRHGFEIIDEFCDRARSGNETNRPGYQRLLRAVRHHAYDVVVAHELCGTEVCAQYPDSDSSIVRVAAVLAVAHRSERWKPDLKPL